MRIIKGTVSELSTYRGEEEFVRSQSERDAGGVLAVGLAAAGLAGPAVGTAMAASGADPVEFFTCKLGEQTIRGRFSKTTFKNGDEVEMAVYTKPDGSLVAQAVRRPADRMLWMVPHCSRGNKANFIFAFRMFGWGVVATSLLLCGSFAIFELYNKNGDLGFALFGYSVMSANALIISAYFSIRIYHRWKPFVRQAEKIFSALGYQEPSKVDLPKDHKLACKARGEKWPYVSDGPWIYHYPEERG